MKASRLAAFSAACSVANCKVQSNPLGSAIALLDELTAKITKEGEAAAKAHAEYVEWCDDVSKNTAFAITTAEKSKAQLVAKIQDLTSNVQAAGSKIDGLASDIAAADSELKDATAIRAKESADFSASETELMESIDT